MENIIETRQVAQGIRLCAAPTERFKTAKISVNMAMPLKKDTASLYAVLVYFLHRSCKKYPDMTKLNMRLAYLYGATISAGVTKIGEAQVLRLSLTSIDERFALDGESVTEKCMELLLDMIFEPNIIDGAFSEKDVSQEKRLMLEKIESERNDKRSYAKQRCEELMCENEVYGINRLGTAEDVEAITPEALYEAWRTLLKEAVVQINVVGTANADKIAASIKERLSDKDRDHIKLPETVIVRKAEKVREVTETMPINQGKLVMGMRVDYNPDERAAFAIMCDVFGGGPYSRLFTNVREKMSLCYYCSARLNSDKGILLVQSGIETENKEKALSEIKNQFEIMKKGEFENEDLEASKKAYADALGGFGDTPEDYDYWCMTQMLRDKIITPAELAAQAEKVTREEVTCCANKVTLDTVYMLEGTGEEEE